MRRSSPVTNGIVFAVMIMFTVEIFGGGYLPPSLQNTSDPRVIVLLGGIVPQLVAAGEYWRLFTALFLHIGLMHLIFNMWALWQLGRLFEIMFGSRRFGLIYFASGLTASVASVLYTGWRLAQSGNPQYGVAAGASGAIFGILGALIIAIRRSPRWRHEQWTRGLVQQLMFWAGLNILFGAMVPGIDNAAHIGGFVTGMLLGFIPHRVPPPPPSEVIIEQDGRMDYDDRNSRFP